MRDMRMALPMRARIGRDALRTLRRESVASRVGPACEVTELRYLGDEGGIVCTLDFSGGDRKNSERENMHLISITHVTFDRRNPLWRAIESYKKHRVKRLKRLVGGSP